MFYFLPESRCIAPILFRVCAFWGFLSHQKVSTRYINLFITSYFLRKCAESDSGGVGMTYRWAWNNEFFHHSKPTFPPSRWRTTRVVHTGPVMSSVWMLYVKMCTGPVSRPAGHWNRMCGNCLGSCFSSHFNFEVPRACMLAMMPRHVTCIIMT